MTQYATHNHELNTRQVLTLLSVRNSPKHFELAEQYPRNSSSSNIRRNMSDATNEASPRKREEIVHAQVADINISESHDREDLFAAEFNNRKQLIENVVVPSSVQQQNAERQHNSGKAQICKPAPQFKTTALLANGTFGDVELSQYKGKWVVLFFYPLDFTFVCPTEIIQFSDRAEEFRALNCEVIAASIDSQFSHLAWTNQDRKKGGLGKMNIPILADVTKSVSTAYGVLKEDEGIAFRGLFIIDPAQNLRQITINDLPVGRNVDETLRLLQAFQFVEEHGEVCPAGWKPGQKTMKADPKGSQEYFGSA